MLPPNHLLYCRGNCSIFYKNQGFFLILESRVFMYILSISIYKKYMKGESLGFIEITKVLQDLIEDYLFVSKRRYILKIRRIFKILLECYTIGSIRQWGSYAAEGRIDAKIKWVFRNAVEFHETSLHVPNVLTLLECFWKTARQFTLYHNSLILVITA